MDQILPLGPQKEPILFTLWLQTSNMQSCEKINPCYFQAPSLCHFTNIQETNISPHLRGCDTAVFLLWPALSNLLCGFVLWSQVFKSWRFSGGGPRTCFLTKCPPLYPLIYPNSITVYLLMAPKFLSPILSFISTYSTGYLQVHLDNSKPF